MSNSVSTRRMAALVAMAAALAPGAALARKVEVTRFVSSDAGARLAQPVAAVPAPGGNGVDGLELQLWIGAVGQAMADDHFAAAPADSAPLLAEVRVQSRTGKVRDPGEPRRVSVGFGGGRYGRLGGFGGQTRFALNGSGRHSHMERATRLLLTIRDRASGQALWEGRADFQADLDSKDNQPARLAPRLAHALLKDFPGKSGETVSVK